MCFLSLHITGRSSDRFLPELKKAHTLLYTPYPPLTDFSSTDGSAQIVRIEQYIYEKRWSSAHNASLGLIRNSLDGLYFLQTYDRFLIKAIVTAAYTGWVAFASLYILRPLDYIPRSCFTSSSVPSVVKISSGVVLVFFWAIFIVQKSPFMFYVYIAFPCYFWQQFLVQIIPAVAFKAQDKRKEGLYLRVLFNGVMTVAALLGMVVGLLCIAARIF